MSRSECWVIVALLGAGLVFSTVSCRGSGGSTPAPLTPPTGVAAISLAPNEITVSWDPAIGAATYNIYWSTTPGVTISTGAEITGAVSPYVHAGLTTGTTCYYVVVSVRGGRMSPESMEVSATPDVPGILDPMFGGNGLVVHDNAAGGMGHDQGYALTLDASGRILVTGGSFGPVNTDMAIWRLNDDGTFDTSFNGQGWVIHDNAAGGGAIDEGQDIALDGSGRIVVSGESMHWRALFDFDMVVWRFNANGTLDTTFNSQGWITHHDAAGGGVHDDASAVALEPSGKILAGGFSYGIGGYDVALWRLLPDATFDTTFGGVGWTVQDNSSSGSVSDAGIDMTLDGSGRILVTGYIDSGSDFDMATWRFLPDGTLDTTFNGQGWIRHDGAGGGTPGEDEGWAITLDSAGRIYVAGTTTNPSFSREMAIWRLLPDGSFDTTFGGQGWITHGGSSGGMYNGEARAIILGADDRVLAAGYSRSATDSDMAIWRFHGDGTPDTGFNGKGWFVHDSAAGGGGDDEASDITLDASGRIVVTGSSENPAGDRDMVVWRFR